MLIQSEKCASSVDVLLIDDSLTDLRLLMDTLLARHVKVSVASDGRAGYMQAVLQKPQLILLDVQMPVQDGFATCRLLKANPETRQIPVIFLTAANNLEQRLEGFAAGGVDYIGKPFCEAEVLARIGVHRQFDASPLPVIGVMGAADQTDYSLNATLVRAAQTLLRQSLASPPSLDNLARMVGTNRRRLNQAFSACCGVPVFTWFRDECLRQAHYLVSNTDTPLATIGDYVGYATPSHFAKAFRERFGCPPRTLRAEMRTASQVGQSSVGNSNFSGLS